MKGQTEQERDGAGRQVAACCCGNQLQLFSWVSLCLCVCVSSKLWLCEQRPSDDDDVPSAR